MPGYLPKQTEKPSPNADENPYQTQMPAKRVDKVSYESTAQLFPSKTRKPKRLARKSSRCSLSVFVLSIEVISDRHNGNTAFKRQLCPRTSLKNGL
jgi:hypothetical protein